ncbi:MAG TPA: NAD-dependent epimerase/dehydratase family protein [Tepidisphaeraceae bacterium]|jgi:CDP-paratose 2-epimerase|nr:NAD-dependent epimerase/dehydratase family protein [Tepidisphaeraceae bacterium]
MSSVRQTVVVTGSSGLIGSEAVAYFDARGWRVVGVDNNMRADFFGPKGDTTWNLKRLKATCRDFHPVAEDVRDRAAMTRVIREARPELVIHAAAQPSHDLAAMRPLDDFDVNAVGTLNLLEATRQARDAAACDPVFILLSTNKVYGDVPNELPREEKPTRWDYARAEDWNGVREDMRIDRCMHSIFGASKIAADLMTQEYGRYFGLKTGVFRGGCLTGRNHAGVQLHGFLNYLFKVAAEGGRYTIFGYKGKQVRDNIHGEDVVRACEAFWRNPRPGEAYNLGGGRANSCSLLEALSAAGELAGKRVEVEYSDAARKGDHICYITDMSKFRSHFPEWGITRSLEGIYEELAGSDSALR